MIELLTWEINTSSALGADGQDVINLQIGSAYDAMIAIFWSRLGSKTPRAASGSVEEYERALDRHMRGDPIAVGVYFKTADPPMDKIDPLQLKGVFDFRKRIEEEGVYHKSFKDDDALSFEIELFLDRLMRTHQQPHPMDRMPSISSDDSKLVAVADDEENDDDLGYYDIIESLESHTARMTAFMGLSSLGIEEINEVVTRGSQRFSELAALGNPDPVEVKKVVNEVTASFNLFSDTIEGGIDGFSVSMAGAASDSLDLIRISSDFHNDAEDVERARENLSELLSSMESAMASMSGFSESIRGLQRMTVTFNKARKRVTLNIDKMVDVMSSSKAILEEALHIMPLNE